MTRRAAVILVAPAAVTLGVYERTGPGRVRCRAWRQVSIGAASSAIREAVPPLVALARAGGGGPITIALRASLRDVRWRGRAAAQARRWRCDLLSLDADDELRLLFLGAARARRVRDGVVAELEPGGLALARFRGRVLAATTRLALGDGFVKSGLPPLGRSGELLVTGSLAVALSARASGPGRALERAAVAKIARARGRDAPAAAALRRLMDRTRTQVAFVARDALAAGLAATLLGAPIPEVRSDRG